ncbi:MAG: hypothetical protein AAFU55_07980, partial [Pseudomonadota bacterium]
PRWFFRMGPRSLFVIPVFVVANFTFLIAFSWLFSQILTLPSDMMTVALQSMSERPPEETEAYRHGEASAGLLGALFVSAAAGWILRRAKRLGIQTGPEVKARDGRSPILFLRSFRDEQVSLKVPGKVALTRFLSQEATPETLDELLAMEGAHHGPVVAIGDPSLHTLRVGAARTFVGDDSWKAVVLDEMKAAQAIVVVVEDTAGSVWEVETIFGDAELLRKTCFLRSPRPDAPGFPDIADHCRDPFTKAVWGSVSKLFREGRLFGLGIGRTGLVAAYAGTASDALDYQVLFRDYFSRVIDDEL